ncbi:hypothetical protein HNV10_14685 [Winogradskyella litoriviva]|uniref:Lipoprotein n=1 Tax=Winogradskyella litoriviva TaxID=1220182 RepID=A0ABX2E9L5_9FLAO|nr:hypothetical protein [Winogradskyella litoriviva]NRD24502.1 hypothetical protein [Winogradskyella litoriviva]
MKEKLKKILTSKNLNRLFIISIFTLVVNCKNYYNDTIRWADNLDSGLSIDDVKKTQPHFVKIDWEDPRIFENKTWYFITKIDGSNDILGMSHYLVFRNDKYLYRESRK